MISTKSTTNAALRTKQNTMTFYTAGNPQKETEAAFLEENNASECDLPKVPRLAPDEDMSYRST